MKHKNSHRWYVGSDAALPGLVVREERVQLRYVHNNSVPLVQVHFLEMVFVALVLGEIYKHLQRKWGEGLKVRPGLKSQPRPSPGCVFKPTWSRVVWETE